MTVPPPRPVPLTLVGETEPPPRADPSLRERWTTLARAGAPEAELVRLAFEFCHEMVFATASRIVGNPWEAEDIAQNVFETLVRRIRSVRDPATLPGFLKTCTVRIAVRHAKRQRWRRAQLEVMRPVSIPEDGPSRAAFVRQLLAQLDDEERVAVVLKHVEQHDLEEVAAFMEVSVPTVRRRLASARARLVAILGDAGVDAVFGRLEEIP